MQDLSQLFVFVFCSIRIYNLFVLACKFCYLHVYWQPFNKYPSVNCQCYLNGILNDL